MGKLLKKPKFIILLLTIVVFSTMVFYIWPKQNTIEPVQAQTNTYYASPNGSGNGSVSNPFQIADFWPLAGPGDTLYLLDGVYTGSNSMIIPPEYLNGTEGNPITVKALNDGQAEIDGQRQRMTVRLYHNDWFVLEGFNAHSPEGHSWGDASVVEVSGSNNNIIRRVVGWDAQDGNDNIFGVHHSENNLLEDVAGFGIARKTYSGSQGGNNLTIRRAWGSWDGSHWAGPKMTYTLAYNNYNMTCENCIGTWTASKMQQTYQLGCTPGATYSRCGHNGYTFYNYDVDQPYAIFGIDALQGDNKYAGTKLLGSIAYIKSEYKFHPGRLFFTTKLEGIEIANSVAYIEPSFYLNKNTFALYSLSGGGGRDLIANDLTGIGGAGSYTSSYWQTSNIDEGVDVSSVGNIFTDSAGARICYRYKDRVLTNEPLWPWPMEQRIYDATLQARGEGVNVTATIEEMFGPIPEECRSDVQPTCLPADLNCDQDIDVSDLDVFKNLWGQTDFSADFNQDNITNTQDFGIMMSKWGTY